ncbi:MAG: class I tRNA ligase family protein, partial [Chloroflexi bacterium]|nr:class I tRNA ligase family protein [Chloroflexota bacterium]
MFDPVPGTMNLPELERRRLSWWREHHVLNDYLKRNGRSPKRFSFIDGPITANNPMGIHHAWGRTYKDLFQRFRTMQGYRQRYQNGFDCQGLWVEVEVEKELGFKSKRDIEDFGIGRFVELCKERVLHFSKRQTEQSIRLGYFMDWDNSYYTMSDENNYMIWSFLKRCHEHGWIYRGHDVMPWCIRCGTALSEHEIATEGYREIEHQSVYIRLPLLNRSNEYLLVWTTTPWTLLANVAAAVNPDLTYVAVEQAGAIYYLSKRTVSTALHGSFKVVAELQGSQLIGWRYRGPFDDLPVASDIEHEILPWTEVGEEEGTGIVHIAPSCGREDLHLWQSLKAARDAEKHVPIPSPIDELGVYIAGFGDFTGQDVATVALAVFESLASRGMLYRVQPYLHRYPVCWRCGSELVFRLVDEWFIALDEVRSQIMRVAEQIHWIPSFGLERELDWLRNMDDWMISKKRYWGLALPFFPCPNCGHLEVIARRDELA